MKTSKKHDDATFLVQPVAPVNYVNRKLKQFSNIATIAIAPQLHNALGSHHNESNALGKSPV
jgi:CO dehydrogenase/acetyl-CoA synthase epsilon subunit